MPPHTEHLDVVVIGGGQAGLATAFYLARSGLSYVVLDAQAAPGGAWLNMWTSLRLFSPAPWSSLPGWMMPGAPDEYPSREQAVAYLTAYERRYQLRVDRPVRVQVVEREGDAFVVRSAGGELRANDNR
jgi:putative flavoprotein involved in K+ transport